MNFNKHTYLGEHKGKANILLSATVDDVFSITLEDEQNEVKSSWEMTMYRDDAEKVARRFAEMLGIIPIQRKGQWIVDEDDDMFKFKKCSNCGENAEWLDGGSQFLSNYCPYCGAAMQKGGAE